MPMASGRKTLKKAQASQHPRQPEFCFHAVSVGVCGGLATLRAGKIAIAAESRRSGDR